MILHRIHQLWQADVWLHACCITAERFPYDGICTNSVRWLNTNHTVAVQILYGGWASLEICLAAHNPVRQIKLCMWWLSVWQLVIWFACLRKLSFGGWLGYSLFTNRGSCKQKNGSFHGSYTIPSGGCFTNPYANVVVQSFIRRLYNQLGIFRF